MWGLAACGSKAKKQARLVEIIVCFISEASMRGWGKWGGDVCPKADSPSLLTVSEKELLQTEEEGYMQKRYSQL